MATKYQADVIVVGAGSAGCYFAWQMAKNGFSVIILESKKFADLGKQIEIFHMDKVRFDQFDIPHPRGDELLHTEDVGYTWSPDLKIKQPVKYTFYVMHMPSFMQRIQSYARKAGARLVENASVNKLLMDKGTVVGVSGKLNGADFEARGKLIVDASGLAGAVRTKLPDDFGIENKPVPPEKCLYVCLELRDEIPAGFPTGSNSYLFHKAFWNKSYGNGAILGIGQPISFDHAWQLHKEWREEYFGNPGKILAKRQGAIPFVRSPYNLVGNGLMLIGDAANQNKPFSGEGVTSGFTAAKIAAEVAAKALQKGSTSKESLWEYNHCYQSGQGAKFAAGLAQLPAAAELTRKDVNYLFKHNIIFSSADFEELNNNYEIVFTTGKLIKVGLVLIWGVITGQFASSSLKKFLGASGQASKIKEHYSKYPANPADFEPWRTEAKRLWNEE